MLLQNESSGTDKCVLIYSGGLDSTVLLYDLLAQGCQVHCLSFDYGQRHRKELAAAEAICKRRNVPHQIVYMPTELFAGSSQTTPSIAVPHGHYADENMKITVVPNRNMVMLALAGAYAISIKARVIAYAAHAGDHAVYPDCRQEFVDATLNALRLGNEWQLDIEAPFLHVAKQGIVGIGVDLEVPFTDTWSCYEGQSVHCGLCGTCVERREAFELAGVEDPTQYLQGLPI